MTESKHMSEALDPHEAHIEYLDMGQWPVHVGFTTCRGAFDREIARLGLEESITFHAREGANMTTHYIVGPSPVTIIAADPAPDMKKHQTRKGVTSVEQYCALLAHEAVHVVQQLKEVLSPHDDLGRESEAYLVQHIVMFCMAVAFDTGRVKTTTPHTPDTQK